MLRSVSRVVRKFRAINARYATPRITMSPMVRWMTVPSRSVSHRSPVTDPIQIVRQRGRRGDRGSSRGW